MVVKDEDKCEYCNSIIVNTSINYILAEKKLLAHKTKRHKEK